MMTTVCQPLCDNHCVTITMWQPLCVDQRVTTMFDDLCVMDNQCLTTAVDNHCVPTTALWVHHCVTTTVGPQCTMLDAQRKSFALNYRNMTLKKNGRQDDKKMMGLWGCAADAQPKNYLMHWRGYFFYRIWQSIFLNIYFPRCKVCYGYCGRK